MLIRWGPWPFTRRATVAGVVTAAIVGAILLVPRPHPYPAPSGAQLATPAQVEAGKPPAKPSLPQRVASVAVRPTEVLVAPGAARTDLARFCAAAGYSARNQEPAAGRQSPAPSGATPELPRAVPPPTALTGDTAGVTPPHSGGQPSGPLVWLTPGVVDGHTLQLWPVRTDGAELRVTARIRGRTTWRADGDSVLIRSSRLGDLGAAIPVIECGAGAALSGVLAGGGVGGWYATVPGGVACLDALRRAVR